MLAKENGADETIMELFPIFHDSQRENEKRDDGHRMMETKLAKSVRGRYFELPDAVVM